MNSHLKEKRINTLTKVVIGAFFLFACSISLAKQGFELELPLIVNKAHTGDITSTITETQENDTTITDVSIPVERFAKLVREFANNEQLSNWLNLSKPRDPQEKTISISTLKERGLEIEFDSNSLSIVAVIPRLGTQQISLRNRETPNPSEFYQESWASSGLNIVARNTLNHSESNGADEGFGDTTVDFTGFTSFGGFNGLSLFYEGSYIENDAQEFARQNVTLIHDGFLEGIRFELGDVRPETSDLQTSPDLLGFNIERNYEEINPFRNINPNGRSSFTLERAARVSFEVNGLIVDTRPLEAGSYSINDFPLAAGANDVRVFIDDGTSRIEVANFSNYVDFTLLDSGISDFGISAGFQRLIGTGRSRRYDDEPSVLAFYNRGITQKVTLGASLEAKQGHHLLSSNLVYGTKYGLFAAQVAASDRDGLDTGYSGILGYNIDRDISENLSIEADVQANYQDNQFVSLTDIAPSDETWSANARLALSSNSQSFSINTGVTSVGNIKTESISTFFTKTYRGFGLSAGFQYSKRDGEESNNSFTLRISKSFGRGRLRGQYRSSNNEFRTEWNGRPSQSAGTIESGITLINDDLQRSAELDVDYTNSRFEFGAQHFSSQARTNDLNNSSSTDLTLATSIGFAGGKFAFGRPFTEGFVIVNTHKNLRGKHVSITQGSTDGDVITSKKLLNTTLVPIETSYRALRYSFNIDELPLGYDLGSGDVVLYPKFLSGYNYQLGSDAVNTVLGKVLWPDGSPLKLISGRLIPEVPTEDEEASSLLVFTNKTGRFVAEKAKFGKYKLVFNKDEVEYFADITIEESDEPGLTQVGTITLTEKQL